MKEKLSDKLRKFKDNLKTVAWKCTKLATGVYIIYSLSSHNGCLDSERTKNAMRDYNKQGNSIKTVRNVDERWKDNSLFAMIFSAAGGSGYNPLVTREVTFEDGSRRVLHYRTLAHQPFVRWIHGQEFDPQPGEKYEITRHNRFVRRID